MKNIQLNRILVLLFSLVIFNSCDEAIEPIDPALIENLQTQNPNCLSPEITSGAFVSSTAVTLTWSPEDGETSWQIEYGVTGFALGSGTLTNATSTTATIAGLQATNGYDFWIRSVCSAQEFGSWAGPFSITPPNPNCTAPNGLTVSRTVASPTSAVVNWTAGGTETSWDVVYVEAGFPIGQGTTLTASSKPFTVTGITSQSYDFYVRAKCSANELSSWSAKANLAAVVANSGVVGTYILTAENTFIPTDLNNDGTSSVNQMMETQCFNNSLLTLSTDNTFIASVRLPEINFTSNTIECLVEPNLSGIWTLSGSQLTITYLEDGENISDIYTVSGNTLSTVYEDVDIINYVSGNYIYVIGNVTEVFTKQ